MKKSKGYQDRKTGGKRYKGGGKITKSEEHTDQEGNLMGLQSARPPRRKILRRREGGPPGGEKKKGKLLLWKKRRGKEKEEGKKNRKKEGSIP